MTDQHAQKKQVKPKKPAGASDQAKLQSQVQEYKDLLQRLQAEFDNALKRSVKEKAELVSIATHDVLARLLIIIDDFEHALKNMHANNASKEDMLKGVQMICDKLHRLMDEQGVKPIECIGKPLDPFKHEVLQTKVTAEAKEGTIVEELQRGYELNGRVLRPARVVVAKAPTQKQEQPKQESKQGGND